MKSLLRLWWLIAVILACEKPENQQLAADQQVMEGLYYADGQPIAITIENGLIKEVSRDVSQDFNANLLYRTGFNRPSG